MRKLWKSRFLVHYPANPSCDTGELAVMIHGLMHNGLYMTPMAKFLAKNGYETYSYDYRTTRGCVKDHAAAFRKKLDELMARHPGRKINIVTHSLGGLVTRQTLGDPSFPLGNIHRVVMLAPPNRGSKVASFYLKYVPCGDKIVRTLADLSFGENSPVHQIPIPQNVEIGIIVASHDILVPRCSTALTCQKDCVVVLSGHTYMMLRPKVMHQTLAFLKSGSFIHS